MTNLAVKFLALFIWILFCRAFIDPSVLQPTDIHGPSHLNQSMDKKHVPNNSDELFDSRIVINYDLYRLKYVLPINSDSEQDYSEDDYSSII